MVHTRGRGARPEGFADYKPPKRERKPMAHPAPQPPPRRSPVPVPKYKDASTQTDVNLTSYPEPASAKRRRDTEDNASDNASKRQRKAQTPDQPKFLFSTSRNRSVLLTAPPKYNVQNESPFYNSLISPTQKAAPEERRSQSAEPERRQIARQPESPTPSPSRGNGIIGSVRKLFGYWSRAPAAAASSVQQGSPPEEAQHDQSAEDEAVQPDSPTPTPRTNQPESPTKESQILDSRIYNRDYFKRRRTANTIGGREQMAAMRENNDSESADFNPIETTGTNKRKLASVDDQMPPPKRGGFGIDFPEVERETDELDGIHVPDGQPSTPARKTVAQTPLRSALRQNGNNVGTIGRSSKSVRINPNTSVKHVYGQYGYAGEYHGSMFSDVSASSESSISAGNISSIFSPTTAQNTQDNADPRFHLDPSVVDPNDESWRPSLANPSPGHFRVPDLDEYDDEDTMTLDQTSRDEVPSPPSTPRMSHAELPQSSSSSQSTTFASQNESTAPDTAESRLEKARSEAQKYKPVRSSRLSLTAQARSRSSSPPGSDSEFRESQIEVSTPNAGPIQARVPDDTTLDETALAHGALGREELDNTTVGDDGMTDYGREHQYDEWAENLDWPEPQTYVDAGVCSSYIADLVRKNWTERDTQESIAFWEREFDEGLKAAKEAKAQGRELVWIVDPEEMID
ncbi:hypothetical protein EDD36DRAFT_463636 [Exophiala viscosa]|uniref:Uncharacterized protein n=1 Tax=Exophiala viscosa TaxID=2486360 RepID=A0AAN6IDS7_9EURO|nr:hypothetical protein EDD36DRAFT_463636 [Exophiala viscosa]